MATHSSVLAWRIPGTGKPGGLASMGSSWTRLKQLSSSSSSIIIYYLFFPLLLPILNAQTISEMKAGICGIKLEILKEIYYKILELYV